VELIGGHIVASSGWPASVRRRTNRAFGACGGVRPWTSGPARAARN